MPHPLILGSGSLGGNSRNGCIILFAAIELAVIELTVPETDVSPSESAANADADWLPPAKRVEAEKVVAVKDVASRTFVVILTAERVFVSSVVVAEIAFAVKASAQILFAVKVVPAEIDAPVIAFADTDLEYIRESAVMAVAERDTAEMPSADMLPLTVNLNVPEVIDSPQPTPTLPPDKTIKGSAPEAANPIERTFKENSSKGASLSPEITKLLSIFTLSFIPAKVAADIELAVIVVAERLPAERLSLKIPSHGLLVVPRLPDPDSLGTKFFVAII